MLNNLTVHSEKRQLRTIHHLVFLSVAFDVVKPFWLISHHLPPASHLKSIPALLVIIFFLFLLNSITTIRINTPLLFYCGVTLLSIVFAYNTGMSRRFILPTLFLLITVTTISTAFDSYIHIQKLFLTFIIAASIVAALGILGNGRIIWHPSLDNEDAFGPFMCITFGMSLFLVHIEGTRLTRICSKVLLVASVVGLILSFARGAFLSFLLVLAFILFQTRRKLRFISLTILLAVFCLITADHFFPNSLFWREMGTIFSENLESGTGRDRVVLWGRAWHIFKDNPIVGVGPRNFGLILPKYLTAEFYRGYHAYGRATHNIFFQIISEGGLLTLVAFLLLLKGYFSLKPSVEKLVSSVNDVSNPGRYRPLSQDDLPLYVQANNMRRFTQSLYAGMIAYLANGFFYDIFYTGWFWCLLYTNMSMHNLTKGLQAELNCLRGDVDPSLQPVDSTTFQGD